MFGQVSETGLPIEVVAAGGDRPRGPRVEEWQFLRESQGEASDRKKPRMMGRKENTGAHC